MRVVRAFLVDGRGATAIEYGLIAALVAVGMIAGFGALSGNLANVLLGISNNMAVPN